MKLFRILLVFAFMLAAVTSTSARAAGGEKVGFIRLISKVDATVPFQLQVRHAYDRIKPQLFALQKKGVILAFEPELKAGIVKIQYAASGVNAAVLPEYQTFDNIQDAVVRTAGLSPNRLSPPAASPEIISPAFFMGLYDSCFDAMGLGADSLVVGSLRDKAGRIISSYEDYADSSGTLYFGCFPWAGPYADVVPGYTVTFKVYDGTSSALLGTFSIVAPDVKFTSINNTKAVVRGTAPAGSYFQVGWSHRNWNAANTWPWISKSGVTSASGTWVKDMSTGKFRGGDDLEIQVILASTFNFAYEMSVPYIGCEMGSNFCEISGFAFQPAALSIVHAGTTYAYSGTFDAFGYFSADVMNGGDPIFLKSGDKVSGTNLPVYTLPAITTTINFAADLVYGKAPINRFFDVWTYTACTCSSYWVYAHSNSTGNYSANFSSQVDLWKTDATSTLIYFQDLATGNITYYRRSFGP